jgi:hypothetical protein
MLTAWNDFFTAQVGASAALAGLIFVGLSINMSKIVSSPILPNRALQALLVLITALVISSVMLVPGQSIAQAGVEVLFTGVVAWLANTYLNAQGLIKRDPQYRRTYIYNIVLTQVASVPYVVGGVVLFAIGGPGVYWLALAILASFLKAITDAWVLLVEINR